MGGELDSVVSSDCFSKGEGKLGPEAGFECLCKGGELLSFDCVSKGGVLGPEVSSACLREGEDWYSIINGKNFASPTDFLRVVSGWSAIFNSYDCLWMGEIGEAESVLGEGLLCLAKVLPVAK